MKWSMILAVLFSFSAQAQFSEPEKLGNKTVGFFSKSWYPSVYSLASFETDKASDEGGRLSTYNYLTLSTFLSGEYKFALRLPFTYGTAGTDRFNGSRTNDQELLIQDPILEVRNQEFAFLPLDMGVYWAARVYLPVSKFSKDSGLIARFRNHFVVSKILSRRLELNYDQKFNYFWQSRTLYKSEFEDEYGFPVEAQSLTKNMEYSHWLTLWAKTGPESGVGYSVKVEDTYWNKSSAENRSKPGERLVMMGPQARIPFTDNVNFILSYEDRVDRENNYKEFGKFYAKNTQVVLHSFVSF